MIKTDNSRVSGVIPKLEGGIPSDGMIEYYHQITRKTQEVQPWKRKQ